MFNFFQDMFNYSDRAIERFESGDIVIDTARVSYGNQPYETGVKHPDYNNGDWVIVQAYDTTEEAKTGHSEWVERMTSESLPEYLRDCQNSHVSDLLGSIDERHMLFPRKG